MAIAAIVVGAAAVGYSAVQAASAQSKAARAQQQQAVIQQQQLEEQRKAQQVQERRSRRAAIRRSQVARAQALSAAQSAGGFGGSAVAGGIGSSSSRLGSALGFSTQMSGISQNITNLGIQNAALEGQIAGYRGDLAQARGIGSIGSTLFSMGAGTPSGEEFIQGIFG